MSAKTKIVVFKAKELIYTGIFVLLGILLILLMIFMFAPSKEHKKSTETMEYIEGVFPLLSLWEKMSWKWKSLLRTTKSIMLL